MSKCPRSTWITGKFGRVAGFLPTVYNAKSMKLSSIARLLAHNQIQKTLPVFDFLIGNAMKFFRQLTQGFGQQVNIVNLTIPSVLLATPEPEPLHTVVAYDAVSQLCHIITACRPDLTHFEADLITRRLL